MARRRRRRTRRGSGCSSARGRCRRPGRLGPACAKGRPPAAPGLSRPGPRRCARCYCSAAAFECPDPPRPCRGRWRRPPHPCPRRHRPRPALAPCSPDPAPEWPDFRAMGPAELRPASADTPTEPSRRAGARRRRPQRPRGVRQLYRRYVERIYAFAYRRTWTPEAAEDVTAATFERAMRHLPRFDPDGAGFGPWLFRIAANELVDHYRREGRTRSDRGQRGLHVLAADTVEDDLEPIERDDEVRARWSTGSARSAPATRRRSDPPVPRRPLRGRRRPRHGLLQGGARRDPAPGAGRPAPRRRGRDRTGDGRDRPHGGAPQARLTRPAASGPWTGPHPSTRRSHWRVA